MDLIIFSPDMLMRKAVDENRRGRSRVVGGA
jgi:hypothetical protein